MKTRYLCIRLFIGPLTGFAGNLFLMVLFVVVVAGSSATAQIRPTPARGPDIKSKIFDISGEIGSYGEHYSISGRENRRPSETGRIFFKPTLNILNNFAINFNLLLSTEGNSARQDINQIDINPKWRWGEAHLVDFTENYSSFTLSGIKIRGASLNLSPGIFRASAVSGITQKQVASTSGTPVYRRHLNGGKIGIGRESGTYFDLIVLSVKDDYDPIENVSVDTTSIPDSSANDDNQNFESVGPQENFTGALISNLSFADKKLSWKSEFSGSAITRDRRSAEWVPDNYPNFLTGIFAPRLSTGIDYAASSEMKLNLNNNTIQAGYQYIGPGYVSLGLASQSSDRQAIKVSLSRRFKLGSIKFDIARQNDNLINQKSFTTNRNTINTGFALKPTAIWNFNTNLTFMTMKNDAVDNSAKVDFTNRIFRLSNGLTFDRQVGLANISADYSYQTSGDSNPARVASNMISHTSTIRAIYIFNSNINIAPSINIINNRQAESGWIITQSYSLATNIMSLRKKMRTGIQFGISRAEKIMAFKTGLTSSYKLTASDTINLQLEMKNIRSDNESGGFDELTTRLTVIHHL